MLSGSFDFEEFSRQVAATAGRQLACDIADRSLEAVKHIHRFTDEVLATSDFDLSLVACKAGCGSCCELNVAVLEPEAELIVHHLHKNWGPAELKELADKASILAQRVSGLDDEERLFLREKCLFLDSDGCCSIHPVRPLLCRSVTSTDSERCRDAIAMVALGETVQVLTHLEQQELYEKAFSGLADAMQQHDLPIRSGNLCETVARLLNNPASTMP